MNECSKCNEGYSNIDGKCQDTKTAEIITKIVK